MADINLNNVASKATADAHYANTSNPHSVTKAQVGLSNADNTSDADKPISTLTQAALDLKQSISGLFAAVMGLVLTGFVAGANTAVAATDTLAQALAKIQGQINARPNETATSIAAITNSTASKNPPIDADEVVGMDSANSFVLIKYSWTNIKAFLKTYFDAFYEPDYVLLQSASASNSSFIDFSGLTSTYHAYKIIITNIVSQTDGAVFHLLTSTNGGLSYDTGAGNYKHVRLAAPSTGALFLGQSEADTKIILIGNTGNNTGENTSMELTLFKPSNSSVYFEVIGSGSIVDAAGTHYTYTTGGARLAVADVDAVRFIMNTGNIASGEFRLYGIKNA